MVVGFPLAFRGGADFLFYLVREVSVLSFVFHSDCDLIINSRFGKKSKEKRFAGLEKLRIFVKHYKDYSHMWD